MKYEVKIVDCYHEEDIYEVETKHDNFFDALHDDLKDIFNIILSDECIEYEFKTIE